MPYDVTFTQAVLCNGAMREIDEVLNVSDETARMLVDLGVATASGLSPQTGSSAALFADTFLNKEDNLSTVDSTPVARTNLDVYSKSESDSLSPLASTTVAGKVQIATDAEALAGASSSVVVTPKGLHEAIKAWVTSYKLRFTDGAWPGAGTIGAGANVTNRTDYKDLRSPTSVVGDAYVQYSLYNNRLGTAGSAAIDWSKRFYIEFNAVWAGALDDVNAIGRLRIGESTSPTVPVVRCIGLEKRGGNAVDLVVHDGTSATYVASTSNPAGNVSTNYAIYSDGTGNVTLYANGISVATTSQGPSTGGAVALQAIYFVVENIDVLTGTQQRMLISNPKVLLDY